MDADKQAVLVRIAAELLYLYADAKAIGEPFLACLIEAAMRAAGEQADQVGAAAGKAEKPGG